MLQEKKKRKLKTFLNPKSKGVSNMKPFRITVILLALVVLPLFASQALADFAATLYDVPDGLVGANTKDKPVIGFNINGEGGNTLDRVKIRSYIQRVYATERVKLWRENGSAAGFQASGADMDQLLKTYITSGIEFDINEEISFLTINKVLGAAETFYITLSINTGAVNANPDYYHQTGLEVTIEDGYIRLTNGEVNTVALRNAGWNGPPDPFFDPYTLIFDTKGPQFDLHVCFEENTCSTYTYYGSGWTRLLNVDQEDSLRICAENVEGDIDTSVDIHVIGWVQLLGPVSSLHMFGVEDIKLTNDDDEEDGCGEACDPWYNTAFRIPDAKNEGGFDGVDADSGHWAICAWAQDTVGNIDTICIEHADLPWRIDTQKPKIDSVTWVLTYDGNGDGKIALGDSIMIIGWGLQNSWEPVFECSKMEVDWSWYTGNPSPDWIELNDVLEHNRIFRRVFGLTNPVAIDSSDCPVNFLVRAWDNACNYDTLTGEICGTMDLDPPSLEVLYEWKVDYDTAWGCMGLGDKVLIRALVGGSDIVSVTAMMDSAGIDALMRHALPLPYKSPGVWDTIWTITEPPIQYGKDADNSDVSTNWPPGPPVDADYRVWVTACDDVHNCVTVASNVLNKTLDTRRPRPIGFACPDTVPCIHAQSKAGGKIDLYWDKDCDENDAYYYYVWASFNGAEFESIGATNIIEQLPGNFIFWHSEPLEEGYWRFKVKTEDNCSNVGDFSCVVGAFADTTPPHVCIAVPDSGLTFGSWFPLKAVADSESHDVASACLWYRLRPDIEHPTESPGQWQECLSVGDKPCAMYRVDDGYVFTDSVHCLEGVPYIGWVELLVVACDEIGNCQDTTSAWLDACLVDDDVFRPGRFLFYWDTLAPGVHLVTVNGFPSPQSACGYDVYPDSMNAVVIDVDGATAADSFEVEVRAMGTGTGNRIFHQDFVTMPCTIWVSVDGWPEGTQNIYIYVKDYDNNKTSDLQVELCVPPSPPDHCIYISSPHEWTRIPCTGTSGYNCVRIKAKLYDYYQCDGVNFTEVRFQWSPNGVDSWETIADVIGGGPKWSTCWDNTGEVEDGDTVYLRVIAHDQYYMADTSNIVKVFVDCTQPQVSLRIEDLYYTCGNEIPKVSCDPLILKAVVQDTLVDLEDVAFFVKRHSDPDIWSYWHRINDGDPAWSDNIWMYHWNEPCCAEDVGFGDGGAIPQMSGCMYPNDYWDIRIAAKDISDNYMFDYDEDGHFDDSTFNDAMAMGAALTVFVDNEAPEPAISLVKDVNTGIAVVNPSKLLGGTGEAYVQAGHDITAEISVLPSEDTCEVMKVHWYLQIHGEWVHVGTSFDPYHYPVTFNPVTNGLIQPYELEDGWWYGQLMAELHDSLGNVETDEITLYILDITPTQALITSPLNESYVWGNVPLQAMALNAYQICKLCYEYRPEGDSVWYPVNGGYPNACITVQEEEGAIRAPGMTLGSNPGDNCGNPIMLHLPADLPFRDQNQTTCGRKDDDNDGCLDAWDGAEDIYYELIITQSVYLDIMLNPKGTDSTAVAIDDQCPLHGSCMYKSHNQYGTTYGWTNLHLDPGTYYLQIDGNWKGPDCIKDFDLSIIPHGFPLEWLTMNTVPDGVYYLRAVATDCDNNVDDNPHTIQVTVANELPTAVIEDPGICKRPCADNPEDTLSYVNGTVTLYATASSTIPVNRVVFYYKNIFGYPDTYAAIDSDYFPTGGKYSVEWNTSSKVADGRYHLKARVYNAAGRFADSDPITVSVDNSGPFSQIISIMGQPVPPTSIDITKGDVIDIELVAIDSTSDEGWTRCYNSGLKSFSVCIENCKRGEEITKCFEVSPAEDGIDTVKWNTSGLEFHGCEGCYYLYVIATDCLGNVDTSSWITVYVSDIIAPVTTIGGFDENYIYGYSTQKIESMLFEYTVKGTTDWIPIGWSSYVREHCDLHMYKTSWDPTSLADGDYWVRVISDDKCSNQNDSLAPVATISVTGGVITPYNPDVLGTMTFEKNWCVGGMHGLVRQTCSGGTPVVIARYNSCCDRFECVDMQANLQNATEFAGSFNADEIDDGGPAKFFSSVTVSMGEIHMTGEPAYVTYLNQGSFDVVQVKRDLGTHGTYQDGCIEVTIPEGAVGSASQYDRYVWVAPTMMPWPPVTQPDIKPIGDNNGYATYVSFTDCYYCCGWWSSHYGGDQGNLLKSEGEGYSDCCFNPGRWAKIKMCYDTTITTDKAHLAVMWWDCEDGKFKSDDIFYPAAVEGFNTTNHTVEFATTCLNGPFAVVELIERPCDGSIVVNMRAQDIEPYCSGYTNSMPTFTSLITDNVEGPSGIDRHSIQFKVDLFESGQLVRIYDAGHYDDCHKWTPGFGSFQGSGFDKVSGIFRAGWNDSTYFHSDGDGDEWRYCDLCYQKYLSSDWLTYCIPMFPLAGGEHMAVVTAMNDHIQTCTDTVHFTVDATQPRVLFDTTQHYVGREPMFNVYMWDSESGVDRSSIYMDLFGSNTSYSQPSYHDYISTIHPDQLASMWVNDTTLRVDLRSLNINQGGGFLHIYIYDGNKCSQNCIGTYYQYYYSGISDCVGNKTTPYWYYYTVDMYGPTITNAYTTICDAKLKFQITDAMSGVDPSRVYVYEDSTAKPLITQDPHNPDYWYYTPSAGPHHVDIRAYDKLGNFTVKSFDLTGDCVPPVVSFIPGYISCKTPTVKIVVSDAGTGVMWDSVKVDLYYYSNLLETYDAFGPNQWTRSGDTLTVVGDGARLGISDGSNLYAVVYYEKTGVTSYSKGPKDLAGNWTPTQWIQQSYTADCYGPSITWKNSSLPCDRPIKLQITEPSNRSGVATVMLYQDNMDMTSSLAYDTSSGLWLYTPSAGKHTLDVIATDVVGNVTTYTFDVKDDCQGPAVSFYTGYVTQNPTIKFTVTDPSGVDWATVNARVYGCNEECYYAAPALKNHVDTETGEVTLDGCNLDCSDGQEVEVWVYSGTNYTGMGPADLTGNYLPQYAKCSFVVDAVAPSISVGSTSLRPIKICISDSKSGVNWSTLEFYEDTLLICEGLGCVMDSLVSLDTAKACIEYTPSAGRRLVEIRVRDNAGNLAIYSFYSEELELSIDNPHNYPNPFDPREVSTHIVLGLSKSAYVTVKIYDFAGEYVTTLQQDIYTVRTKELSWNGTTEDGTKVANGTYLCHIKARDDKGAVKTAVIKITVKKEDK
jgi:hypothetical protein